MPLGVLHAADHLVCCDGAAVDEAEVIIGDGDSVCDKFRSRLIQVDEQDDNDLTKATRYVAARFGRQGMAVAYLGCTGGREDHTLGNLSLMVRYQRELAVRPTMLTDTGWFVVGEGRQTFASFPRQQVSIFNFGCTRIESEGLRWNTYAYSELWQGTLNEATADGFTLDADGRYLVYRTYEAKQPRSF